MSTLQMHYCIVQRQSQGEAAYYFGSIIFPFRQRIELLFVTSCIKKGNGFGDVQNYQGIWIQYMESDMCYVLFYC